MKQKDTDILRDAVTDVLTLREVAKETAMDHLREAFTPKMRKIVADQLRKEAEGEEDDDIDLDVSVDSDDEGEEEEVELDLDDDDDDDEEEEEEDMDDMSDEEIEEIASFLYGVDEAVADDGRHSDPDRTDQLSYDEPQHDGGHEDAPMLDMGEFEDGYTGPSNSEIHEKLNLDAVLEELEGDMEDEDLEEALHAYLNEMDYEEMMDEGDYEDDEDMDDMDESYEIDIDALLSEYGVTDVTRDPMEDPVDLSGPYDDLVDDLMDTSDNYTNADYGFESGQMDYDAETMPDGSAINESVSLRGLLREMEEEEEEMETDKNMAEGGKRKLRKLQRENEELQERLGEYREVLNTLRKQVNEVNLVNSKLLYTNKLNNTFKLNTRQHKRIVDAFDRAQNLREVKLTYANLAENFNENHESGSPKKSRESSSLNSLTESLDRSLEDNSTKPKNTQILNENTGFSERMKKLAGINNR